MDGKYEETFINIINFVDKNIARTVRNKSGVLLPDFPWEIFIPFISPRHYPNSFVYVGLFSAAIMPDENAKSGVYKNIEDTLLKQKRNGYKLY